MNFNPIVRLACVSLLAGTMLVGCSVGGDDARPARLAGSAEVALSRGKVVDAVAKAESAVMADPRNAAYRALLGDSYLRAGRFASAAASFEDAIVLGETGARTVVGLALAQIAIGRQREAVDTLDAHRDRIPAGDYGLALALAGETARGVAVLFEVVRAGEADARLRQNLAYAYALDGRWREAQVMAAQDMSPADVQERITQWALVARPEQSGERVAGLLRVIPQADAGQPAHLALANFAEPMAALEPESATPAESELEPVATAVHQPVEAPAVAEASEYAQPAATRFVSQPVIQELPQATASAESKRLPRRRAAAPAMNAPVFQPAALSGTAALAAGNGGQGAYAIQLGAYLDRASAKAATQRFASKHQSDLPGNLVTATALVGGRQMYRVAATGFAGKDEAVSACRVVRAKGGQCLVRRIEEVAPAKTPAAPTRVAAKR